MMRHTNSKGMLLLVVLLMLENIISCMVGILLMDGWMDWIMMRRIYGWIDVKSLTIMRRMRSNQRRANE